jgi:hypothetical protein
MKKRLLSRLLHERVPGLRSSDGYFFRGDFEHILQGVVLEYVPRGLYVWNFRFPLFDFFGPHLTFSRRLAEHPFITKGEMSEEAIVDFIMATPELQQTFDAKTLMSLVEFFNCYLVNYDPLRNPRFPIVHAAALVLLGQDSQAANVLKELPPTLHPNHITHWNQLKASLEQGPEAARLHLDRIRQDNLQAFGVT